MNEARVIETTGADVEAAVSEGLARLGARREDVTIAVLDEGSRGLFGLGTREARVRLTLPPPSPPPPPPPPVETPAPPVVEAAPAAPASPVAEKTAEDELATARDVLLELLQHLGFKDARVEMREAPPEAGEAPTWVLDVHGTEVDALIGRRGETLAALQHITRLIAGREIEGRLNMVVDVEGYKARREKSLRRLAQRMAEQAVRTARRVVLEPMPPDERRIIHIALRDHPGVVTESIGEGERRKVTIIPR